MNYHTQMNTVFTTVFNRVQKGSFLLQLCVCIKYLQLGDGACGTGGMLTVAQDRLLTLAARRGKNRRILPLFSARLDYPCG